MPEIKETDLLKIDRDWKKLPVLAVLGDFIATFACAEATLHVLLRKSTGTDDAKARILCKEMRTRFLTKKIKDLRGIPEIPIEQEHVRLNRVFEQFDKINEMRDFLVHRGNLISTGLILTLDWITSKKIPIDRNTALSGLNAYSTSTLTAATNDLIMIGHEIGHIAGTSDLLDSQKEQLLTYAWQYKPAPPTEKELNALLIHLLPLLPQRPSPGLL